MIVALLTVQVFLPESQSLKAKRSVLRPLLERIRRDWNVSAADTDHQDTWQRAAIAIATVNTEAGRGEESLRAVLRYIEANPALEVLESSLAVLANP